MITVINKVIELLEKATSNGTAIYEQLYLSGGFDTSVYHLVDTRIYNDGLTLLRESLPECRKPEQSKLDALIQILEIYSNTESPVSQSFYQGLCKEAIEIFKAAKSKISKLERDLEQALKDKE